MSTEQMERIVIPDDQFDDAGAFVSEARGLSPEDEMDHTFGVLELLDEHGVNKEPGSSLGGVVMEAIAGSDEEKSGEQLSPGMQALTIAQNRFKEARRLVEQIETKKGQPLETVSGVEISVNKATGDIASVGRLRATSVDAGLRGSRMRHSKRAPSGPKANSSSFRVHPKQTKG